MTVTFGTQLDDTLTGTNENDTIFGRDGNDILSGDLGDDLVFGEQGNDFLSGNDGSDRLFGGDGIDVLNGDNGDDSLFGENGNDNLYGDDGNDRLIGGFGDDYIGAGSGNDSLYGEDGNDTLIGSFGNDFLYGGAGDDLIEGAGFANLPRSNSDGFGEIDVLTGGQGSDTFKLWSTTGYNGRRTSYSSNNSDYALITDFNIYNDVIQLTSVTYEFTSEYLVRPVEYSLGASPEDLPSGTGIYVNRSGQQELIAVLQGVSPNSLSLSEPYFQLIASPF